MKTLGKFEILERLGQGAMGVVYKARDPLIGRLVALKTITTGLAEDPSLLERFYREAHSAGALQHPNIVTIYELGEADKTPFIAMEYLAGQSLDKLIEDRPTLPLSQKVGYVAYVCRALAYAHKQGVVHRDVKPGNVMVTTDGIVKVVDFGIASVVENSKSQSGLLIGTLGYMSPQQLEGRRADAKSDIWAAGVLFYELLAHRRPFDGENYGALMLNIMTQDVPPLAQAAPGTPMDVAAVIDRMLRKDPGERFQSMEEALLELEPVWRGLQRSEVSDLLADSQKMLKAGDVTKAYETVRRVLQIDTANSQAKTLLETINAEIRLNRTVPPAAKTPQDDETIIVPAANVPRPAASSVTTPAAPKAVSSSDPSTDTINRLRAIRAQQPADVRAEVPPPTPVIAAAPKWKQPISIALLVFGVMLAGGGTYFFAFRRPGIPASEAPISQVAKAAPASSTIPVSETPAAAPALPAPSAGNIAPSSADTQHGIPVAKPAGTNPPVGTNKSIPGAATSQPQPATPASSTRTEVAVSNPVPPPSAERPAQPAAASPEPVAVPSQPAPVAAPTPAPKAADPAPVSKPVEAPAAVASAASTGPDSLDRQAITLTLQQLSAAFSHRSLAELQEIWPKLGPNRDTFKKVFDNTKSLSREFHIQSLNIAGGGDTATAIGSYDGKFLDGRGKETPSSGNFYVRLSKRNGRWYIDDASF